MKPFNYISQKENRSLQRVMIEINTNIAFLHKKLPMQIDVEKYAAATEYVTQFISYTTVWNVKFTYNLESPEVALMQLFHLEYILEQEDQQQEIFRQEWAMLQQMKQLFSTYSPYSSDLIDARKNRFLQHIHNSAQ